MGYHRFGRRSILEKGKKRKEKTKKDQENKQKKKTSRRGARGADDSPCKVIPDVARVGRSM
jgi:hypothetical protein